MNVLNERKATGRSYAFRILGARLTSTVGRILIFASMHCASWAANPTFVDRVDYPTKFSRSVAVFDANADKVLDIISASGYGVQTFFGAGRGSFRLGPSTPMIYTVSSFAAVDVNQDGVIDLLMGACDGISACGLAVSLGRGDGTFGPQTFYSQPGYDTESTQVVIGDMNGDHIPDVALIGYTGIWVYFGRRGGTFTGGSLVPVEDAFPQPSGLVALDINNDGILDLAATTLHGLAVLTGVGNGSFSPPVYYGSVGSNSTQSIAVGDVNGDGYLDLVASSILDTDHVQVFLGDGVGRLGLPSLVYLPSGTLAALGDINGDGILDVVSGLGYIALGVGDGTFKTPQFYPFGGEISPGFGSVQLLLTPLMGSGPVDIVSANYFDVVSVINNEGGGHLLDSAMRKLSAELECATAGNLNNDGPPDFVVVEKNTVTVLLGTGNPAELFTPSQTIQVPGAYCAVIGDLNNDGVNDLVILTADSSTASGSLKTFLGTGAGMFTPGTTLAIRGNPGDAILADFNNDGNLDVALSGNFVTLGNGDGSFRAPSTLADLPFGSYIEAFAVGDLNGDGYQDIVADEAQNQTAFLLLSKGNGMFNLTTFSTASGCSAASAPAIADLNGDGKLDVLFLCAFGQVALYRGDGAGGLQFYQTLPNTFTSASSFVVTDLNGDGALDIGIASQNSFGVFVGNGDGTFNFPNAWFGLGPYPGSIVTGEFRGQPSRSGKPDVIVTDGSDSFVFLPNITE